jgi:hypothetical protein
MATKALKTLALSAGLLLASATLSAYAIDVGVGGVTASALGGGGAPAATANSGGALGGVTATGKALDNNDGTVADVNLGFPSSNKAKVRIGSGAGPLAAVDSNGNPVNGGNASNAAINLGSIFGIGGIGDDTGGGGGAGAGPGNPGQIVAGLSSADRAKVRANCRTVLSSPASYQRNLVSICRLLKM